MDQLYVYKRLEASRWSRTRRYYVEEKKRKKKLRPTRKRERERKRARHTPRLRSGVSELKPVGSPSFFPLWARQVVIGLGSFRLPERRGGEERKRGGERKGKRSNLIRGDPIFPVRMPLLVNPSPTRGQAGARARGEQRLRADARSPRNGAHSRDARICETRNKRPHYIANSSWIMASWPSLRLHFCD